MDTSGPSDPSGSTGTIGGEPTGDDPIGDNPTGGDPTAFLPPPFTDTRRRFARTSGDRHIGGVAGGLARDLGVDALWVRIAFVVVAILSLGVALSGYVAAWLLLPDDTQAEAPAPRWFREHGNTIPALLLIVGLTVVGVLVITGLADLVQDGDTSTIPLLAGIALVGYLMATRSQRIGRSGASSSPGDPMASTSGTAYGTTSEMTAGIGADPTLPHAVPVAAPEDPETVARRVRHRAVRNGAALGALGVGAAGTVLWATGAWSAPGWVVPAAVLAILLAGLAFTPLVGWSWTLATLAVLTVPVLVLTLIPGVRLQGGVGDRFSQPATAGEIAPRYELGVGRQEVDLTTMGLRPGAEATVRIRVGIGGALVRVPANATVRFRGHVSVGDVRIDGTEAGSSGTDVDIDRTLPADDATLGTAGSPTTDDATPAPRIDVIANVGIGTAEIIREP